MNRAFTILSSIWAQRLCQSQGRRQHLAAKRNLYSSYVSWMVHLCLCHNFIACFYFSRHGEQFLTRPFLLLLPVTLSAIMKQWRSLSESRGWTCWVKVGKVRQRGIWLLCYNHHSWFFMSCSETDQIDWWIFPRKQLLAFKYISLLCVPSMNPFENVKELEISKQDIATNFWQII